MRDWSIILFIIAWILTVIYIVLEVKHVDSRNDPGIQLADYCSGAAFAKFERGDATYYNLIKDKIVFKTSLGNIEW